MGVKVNGTTQAFSQHEPGHRVSNAAGMYVGAKTSSSDVTTGRMDRLTVTKG